MIQQLEYLNLPTILIICIVSFLVISNVVGEILEFKGKVVPEFIKIRKYFQRKKKERETLSKLPEMFEELSKVPSLLANVQTLLNNVEQHYDDDNITKRNNWMTWVNTKAKEFETKIDNNNTQMADFAKKLDKNNEDTLALLIEHKRSAIIDFASRVIDENNPVTREQFNRIFRIHTEYDNIIKSQNLTNGEVDIAYRIITEAYATHMKNHTFIEDIRGY